MLTALSPASVFSGNTLFSSADFRGCSRSWAAPARKQMLNDLIARFRESQAPEMHYCAGTLSRLNTENMTSQLIADCEIMFL